MFRIEKTFSKPNISKTIRFTERLDSELIKIAKDEGISFNELVLRCCQYALDEYQSTNEHEEENKGDR